MLNKLQKGRNGRKIAWSKLERNSLREISESILETLQRVIGSIAVNCH